MSKQVRWSRIRLKDQSVWVACEPNEDQALDVYFENLLRFVPLSTRRHVSPDGKATMWSVTNDLWKTRVQDELEGMGVDLVRDAAVGKRILGDNAAPGAYGTAERAKAQAEDRRRRAEEGAKWYRDSDQARKRAEAERVERIRRMFREAGADPNRFGGGGFPGFHGADFSDDDFRDAFNYARAEQAAGRGNPFEAQQGNAHRQQEYSNAGVYGDPFGRDKGRAETPPRRDPPPPVRPGKGPTADDWRALFLVQGAPAEVVRSAHRALALKYHPDRGGGNEAKLVAVNVARDKILQSMGEDKVS